MAKSNNRQPNYSMDDFNIENYTRQVDFGDGRGSSASYDDYFDSPDEDTGEYTPASQRQEGSGKKQPRRRRKAPFAVRMLKKLIFLMIWLICVVIVGFFIARAGWNWANDLLALDKPEAEATITLTSDMFYEEEVTDEEGNVSLVTVADMDLVAQELNENGLIEYNWLFKLFATFTNKDQKLSPGSYELNSDMDYSALLRNMGTSSTSRATVTVTVPEGYTLAQTISLLAEQQVASEDELWDAAANYDFEYDFLSSDTLGEENRLEGFLFPDTYEFYQNGDAATALARMLANFNTKIYSDLDQSALAEAEADGYSVRDLVIIASIIEKETDGVDQASISSVIYNRMTNNEGGTNGYLQMDSTIQYILEERKETLSYEDLSIDSPYNTYLYKGLPAGPICNPGMDSLEAALSPEDSNYYYFILGDDGSTHFFSDYDEFLAFRDAQTGVIVQEEEEETYVEG